MTARRDALSHADLIDRVGSAETSGKLVLHLLFTLISLHPLIFPSPLILLPLSFLVTTSNSSRWLEKTHLLYFRRLDKSASSIGYTGGDPRCAELIAPFISLKRTYDKEGINMFADIYMCIYTSTREHVCVYCSMWNTNSEIWNSWETL